MGCFFSLIFFFFLFSFALFAFVCRLSVTVIFVKTSVMREPLTTTKTKTKKKEASRATLEKDDAQTDFSVKERIETAMMEVLGKRGLEKAC